MMTTSIGYFGWVTLNPKATTGQNIAEACALYEHRRGRAPRVALVNPAALVGLQLPFELVGLQVHGRATVSIGSVLLGDALLEVESGHA